MAAHSAIDIVQQNSLTTLVRRELERGILDGGLVLASRERLHAALADPTAPPAKPARAA